MPNTDGIVCNRTPLLSELPAFQLILALDETESAAFPAGSNMQSVPEDKQTQSQQTYTVLIAFLTIILPPIITQGVDEVSSTDQEVALGKYVGLACCSLHTHCQLYMLKQPPLPQVKPPFVSVQNNPLDTPNQARLATCRAACS